MSVPVIASDTGKDLALLQAPIALSVVAAFRDPPDLDYGEGVSVIGYPLHGKVAIKPIQVTGVLHGPNRMRRLDRFSMRIDVRRGNSGGPVLDRSGRVIGVVVAKINTPEVYAATGRLIRDVAVGIRAPVALDFLRRHDVALSLSKVELPLSNEALFARASNFVAQIGCWR